MDIALELLKLKRIIMDEISRFENNNEKRFIYDFFYSCLSRLSLIQNIELTVNNLQYSIRLFNSIFNDPITVTVRNTLRTDKISELWDIIMNNDELLGLHIENKYFIYSFGEEAFNIWYPLNIKRDSPNILIVYKSESVQDILQKKLNPFVSDIEYISLSDFPEYYRRIRFNFEAMFICDKHLICDRQNLIDLIELLIVPVENRGIVSNDIFSSLTLQDMIWRNRLILVNKSLSECIHDPDFARVFNIYRLYLRVILNQINYTPSIRY